MRLRSSSRLVSSAPRFRCVASSGPGAGSRGAAAKPPAPSSEPLSSSSLAAHSSLCGGGGGAHVGSGGDGVHALTGLPCNGSGGLGYDRGPPAVLPKKSRAAGLADFRGVPPRKESSSAYASTASASGGGGDLAKGGSGGGFVWVQGQAVTVDGMILADGGGGELMQDAVIDVEVEPENCAPLAPPTAEIVKGPQDEAEDTVGQEGHPPSDSSSVEASPRRTQGDEIREAACKPRTRGSLSKWRSSGGALLPLDTKGEAWRAHDAQGAGEGAPAGASVSCQLSGILSDPAQLGQGGGGGGSVVIETGTLRGGGIISAEGGPGGRCTGGGGGGGAINFLWDTSPYRVRGQSPQHQRPSTTGSGSNKEHCEGLDGPCVDVSHPSPKEYPQKGDGPPEGPEGFSLFIPWLRPFDFASGFSGSLRVGGGGSDPSTACGPLQLPLGHQGAPGEVRSPLGCPPGYSGWRCSPCPIGFYSLGGDGTCLSCINKPSDDAFYTREGVGDAKCPFACSAGLPDASVNPRCLPPFLFLLERLLAWEVLVPLGALWLALLGLGALLRMLARWRGQQGWGYGALFGVGGSLAPVSVSRLDSGPPSSGFGALQPSPPSSMGFLGGSNERRLLHLAVPHLTLEDLPFHVFRIYLHGRNSPHSPWGLDGHPPPFLDPLVTPHRFTAFAATANALCGFSRHFVLTYRFLSFFYPPLAALLLRAARARRADRMVALCSALAGGPSATGDGGPQGASRWGSRGSWDSLTSFLGWGTDRGLWGREKRRGSEVSTAGSFWRSIRARELSFALKFGCDPDCTLGFVDVLDLDRNILDYRCSPQLPLVLLTQGDGRIVPFSLARGLREPASPRAAQQARQADGKGSPADPLQAALEELAPPSIWAFLAEFFSSKVKEITAEELGALRALVGTEPTANCSVTHGGAAYGGQSQEVGEWMGASPSSRSVRGPPGVSSPFSRCGRCGRLQLPCVFTGGTGAGPLGMVMGGPIYALRTVARLYEGIRLMSDRLLKPHGIAASVVLLTSRGFVSRADGVRRVAGTPQETGATPPAISKSEARRPADGKVDRRGMPPLPAGRRGGPSPDSPAPALRAPLGTGRLLLRAASSPSALLDSLRRNGGEPFARHCQETNEAAQEAKGMGAFAGSDAVVGPLENSLRGERGASTASLERLLYGSQQGAVSRGSENWEGNGARVETEAAFALVITEEASESEGEEPPAAPGTREGGTSRGPNAQVVVVPCFPPVSSLAVTSPLDPRRLSRRNQALVPYTGAAGPALQKPVPYWGVGGPPISYYPSVSGGPSPLRQSFDRPIGPSPRQHMPTGFRGVRRVGGPFNDPFSPESQVNSAVSPHGYSPWGPMEALRDPLGSERAPVMCLADAARRSAGADAQHLRDAVEALQKTALAKLGTGAQGAGASTTPDESVGFSRITTMGGAEPEPEGAGPHPGNGVAPAAPGRGPHSLALLQLAWRRLRLRSSPTDLARQAITYCLLQIKSVCLLEDGASLVSWPINEPIRIYKSLHMICTYTAETEAFSLAQAGKCTAGVKSPKPALRHGGCFLRTYVLAAALAVHVFHMAATGVYFFGLKSTSFTVAWPQPFPSGVPAARDSVAWALPINSFWFRGEDHQAATASQLITSPPMQGSGLGPSPAGTAVTKWAGLAPNLGGSSWGLLAVALSVPPLADLLCFLVGFWLFLAADARQEQLFCMAVGATMPKHIVGMQSADGLDNRSYTGTVARFIAQTFAMHSSRCGQA